MRKKILVILTGVLCVGFAYLYEPMPNCEGSHQTIGDINLWVPLRLELSSHGSPHDFFIFQFGSKDDGILVYAGNWPQLPTDNPIGLKDAKLIGWHLAHFRETGGFTDLYYQKHLYYGFPHYVYATTQVEEYRDDMVCIASKLEYTGL